MGKGGVRVVHAGVKFVLCMVLPTRVCMVNGSLARAAFEY